jgi:putative hydrolase of the HAD superfamily
MHTIDKIQLVAFDLDDTLYSEMAYAAGGFRNVAEVLAKGDHTLSDQLFQKMSAWQREGRRDVFQAVLLDAGSEPTDGAVLNLLKIYRLSDRPLTLYPDAERAIERFRQAGKKLAILTDGYLEAQRKKIEWLKLVGRVDEIVCTDELGREFWKPCTKGFQMLMEKFAVPPEQCVYIADNELKDFAGPKKLGWRTIKILRPEGVYREKLTANEACKPDLTVTTLDEIKVCGAHPTQRSL